MPSQRHPVGPASRPLASTAVSDRDRDRCVERLREHCGEGRLTPEELEDRIDLAMSARTKRDLRRATAGLPMAPVVPRGTLRRVHRTLLGVHATAYTAGNGSAVALWAATGEGLFAAVERRIARPLGMEDFTAADGREIRRPPRCTRPRRP